MDDDQLLHPQVHADRCDVLCVCPSEYGVRIGNGPARGQLNVSAFLVHIFCVTCKVEITLTYDLTEALDEEGLMTIHFVGECTGCGKDVEATVNMQDPDAPRRGDFQEATMRSTHAKEEPESQAERLALVMQKRRTP